MDIPPESSVIDYVPTVTAGVDMYRRLVGVILFVTALAVAVAPPAGALGASLLTDGFDAYPTGVSWVDGSLHGNWSAVYNGYGSTNSTGATLTVSTATGYLIFQNTANSITKIFTNSAVDGPVTGLTMTFSGTLQFAASAVNAFDLRRSDGTVIALSATVAAVAA